MAQYQNHISFSIIISLCYAFVCYYFFHVYYEVLILAVVLIVITGILPDIDASENQLTKELAGLIAALTPVFLIRNFPLFHAGGITRMALVFICSYVIVRLLVVRGLKSFTKHRGMIHSIPTALLIFEVCYFIFYDVVLKERLVLATAAFIGFFSHLFLDAYGNLDIVGSALGKSKSGQPALKLVAPNIFATMLMYTVVGLLGWHISQDFYPSYYEKLQKTSSSVKKK